MAAWLTNGSLLAASGEEVEVDFYLAAKGAPHPDWGSRLHTTVEHMPVLHVQGQSKQVAPESRQVLYLSRFGLDITGAYSSCCSCCLQFRCSMNLYSTMFTSCSSLGGLCQDMLYHCANKLHELHAGTRLWMVGWRSSAQKQARCMPRGRTTPC